MCGIAGILRTSDNAPTLHSNVIEHMTNSLIHRGPDTSGHYVDHRMALGMRRLSIIDLATGDQPMTNEAQSIHLVSNGEIYNFPELRAQLTKLGHSFASSSDTECLVHGYEEWGENLFSRINGMFATAIWDPNQDTLLLARDRTGIKPLYYTVSNGLLIFGSELKAILSCNYVNAELDLKSLGFYLSMENVPSPKSIFKDIHKLRSGHYLRVTGGEVTEIQYWDFQLNRSENTTDQSPLSRPHEFRGILQNAVQSEMASDVPVGVLLSGGLDSSAIAALAARETTHRLQTFSIGFDEPSFDESKFAREASSHIGTDHYEKQLTASDLQQALPKINVFLDEPLADASIIPTFLVSKFAREHVKVVLGGDGGDEMLAGYSTMQAHKVATAYRMLPSPIRDYLIPKIAQLIPVGHNDFSFDFKVSRFIRGASVSRSLQHQMWLGSFYGKQLDDLLNDDVKEQMLAADVELLVGQELDNCQADDQMNRLLRQDMRFYMEGGILTKVDRASMSVSLETRVPFLNKIVLDYLESTPVSLKLRGFKRKWLLRQAMKDLLPKNILDRKKKGFSMPVAKWLAEDLHDLARAYLSPERIGKDGLFNPNYVTALLDDHTKRRRNHHKLLWTLLMFQLWKDEWLDNRQSVSHL